MMWRRDLPFHPDLPTLLPTSAATLGLEIGLSTTLKTVPASLHWHLGRRGTSGTIEVTWDPLNQKAWIEVRLNRTGNGWTEAAAAQLAEALGG